MTDYKLDAEGGRYEVKGGSVQFTQALESWIAVRRHQALIQHYAIGVLEDALDDLADTGRFPKGKARSLAEMMAASKGQLPWRQFDTVDQGRERRNQIAHDRAIIPMAECLT